METVGTERKIRSAGYYIQKYPQLIFQKENRILGNLGCNGFGGNVEFKASNAIKIANITPTEMALS